MSEDERAERIRLTAEGIDATLALLPVCAPTESPRAHVRLWPIDAPLTYAEASALPIGTWAAPSGISAEEHARFAVAYDRQRRREWDARFAMARASLPEKFAWVVALQPPKKGDRPPFAPLPDEWRRRLPWFTPEHLRRLFDIWKERTSVLICGKAGLGKTTLAILDAAWTLAVAGYDSRPVQAARHALETWAPSRRNEPAPPEPEWLPEVNTAQGLRFYSSTDLLTAAQDRVDEQSLKAALAAPALYLDEIGRELYGSTGASYLATARRPAVSSILERFWRSNRRVVATSPHAPEALADLYDAGSFRRMVEDKSGAVVVDLCAPEWAGPWLASQTGRARR